MLKIAAGVFLGIMAVLLVINVPGWLRAAREEHQADVVRTITPEKLIANCGQPLKDKQEDIANQHLNYERRMTYQGRVLSPVVATFYGGPKTGWNLNHAEIGGLSVGMWQKDGAGMLLDNLPCMDK